MKIAVLMSTYNGHDFLGKQLESLAGQTVAENITVYIRDDGSSDDTFDIIDYWKKDLNIVLYKGKNTGPARSFWKLLMNPEIQADYYAFCDQDDVWDTNKIEKGIDRLKGNVHLYACNCRIIDENSKVLREYRTTRTPNMDIQKLFVSGCTQGCSMIFSDTLCQYIRKLSISCVPMHDIVLMLYAIYKGEIYWDSEPHFGYRVHFNNVVAKNNKSIFKRIKTTIWNWNNSSKNSMSKVASEMVSNIPTLSENDRLFLKYIADYKKHRVWLIRRADKYKIDKDAVRSYKIRILLGLY